MENPNTKLTEGDKLRKAYMDKLNQIAALGIDIDKFLPEIMQYVVHLEKGKYNGLKSE